MATMAQQQQQVATGNLAIGMDKKRLKELGALVYNEYKADIDSRAEWERRRKIWLKLLVGHREARKTHPWDGASNVHIPLLGVAVFQFNARAYPALIPPKELVKIKNFDTAARNAATRVGAYMNWSLRYRMKNFISDMDKMLVQLPLNGTSFKKTYADKQTGQVVSKLLPIEEVVIPYGVRNIDKSPRITHAFYMYEYEIKERQESQTFLKVKDLGPGPDMVDNAPAPQLDAMKEKIEGVYRSSEVEQPRLILEQHRRWDLDNNGRQVPVVVTVDEQTQQVLRIVRREINGVEVNYFTAYTFIPNPESHLGIGLGHLMEHLTEAATSLCNQIIDAGTLQNTKMGFFLRRAGLTPENFRMRMGEYRGIDSITDDIRKIIMTLDFGPPSQALFTMMSMLTTYSEKISSVSDAMMGQLPPSDTPASTMLAAIEQGQAMFSAAFGRIHNSFGQELRKIYFWESLTVQDAVYAQVQDSTLSSTQELLQAIDQAQQMIAQAQQDNPDGQMNTETRIAAQDFMLTHDIAPVSDPGIISRTEEMAKAEKSYQLGMQEPVIAQDPQRRLALLREVYKTMGTPNAEQLTQPPPPPPPPPDLPPHVENANFLNETDVEVLPIQDHQHHVEIHKMLEDKKYSEQLTPQGRNLLKAHNQKHYAAQYLKEHEREIQQHQQQQQGGPMQ